MSADPSDFEVLTPGDFSSLSSVSETEHTVKRDNYLSQWEKLSKMVQFISRKWKLDYLMYLQASHK